MIAFNERGNGDESEVVRVFCEWYNKYIIYNNNDVIIHFVLKFTGMTGILFLKRKFLIYLFISTINFTYPFCQPFQTTSPFKRMKTEKSPKASFPRTCLWFLFRRASFQGPISEAPREGSLKYWELIRWGLLSDPSLSSSSLHVHQQGCWVLPVQEVHSPLGFSSFDNHLLQLNIMFKWFSFYLLEREILLLL